MVGDVLDAVHAVVAVFTAVPPGAAVVVHVLAAVSHIAGRVLTLGALENPLLACRETVREMFRETFRETVKAHTQRAVKFQRFTDGIPC